MKIGELQAKVALITGASSGIGEAAAIALANAGVSVALSARRADRLASVVSRIASTGGNAIAVPGDMTKQAMATAAVERTIAEFGRIDILINSAGVLHAGGIENTNGEEYRQVMDANLMATIYTCSAAIGPMKAQGRGDIINISSQASRKTRGPYNAYVTSKHALNVMTSSMRQEVTEYGIRVCALLPGATNTDLAHSVRDAKAREAMRAHLDASRAIDAREVADVILFVLSMPNRTNIDYVSIRPTLDASATSP